MINKKSNWGGVERNIKNKLTTSTSVTQENEYIADAAALKILNDKIYPVGSIYMSVNNTNPSTLFGGTWEQLKDRFLLGAGDTYTNGNTGGESTHTLTIDEMPSHNHSITNYYTIQASGFTNAYGPDKNGNVWNYRNPDAAFKINNTGGGKAHNNMPPYLVVYMWKRTA